MFMKLDLLALARAAHEPSPAAASRGRSLAAVCGLLGAGASLVVQGVRLPLPLQGRIKNELIAVTEETPVDEETAAVAKAIVDAVDEEYGAKFATSEVELNGDKAPGNRNMETNLGDLITDSMLWGVLKDMDAETLGVPEENVVAITNGGGIRAWIHAGDVTKNDVNTVLPFGNTVAVVYVTGAELLEALEASTYSTPGAVGGFPQVSGIRHQRGSSRISS